MLISRHLRKRVMLVYPPSLRCLREDRCQVPADNVIMSPPLPPSDLLSLAAVAEEVGCLCRVADYPHDGGGREDFRRDLVEFEPDFLLVSTTTPTLSADMEWCTFAKAVLPSLTIVAKGAHFLTFADEVLERVPAVDALIRGEAELTLRELLREKEWGNIDGLTWRAASGIVNNPPRAFLDDLDSLPFPARHLIENHRYVRPDNGKPVAVIRVSRGCPYHCFFCLATPVSGNRVRMRSPGNILQEIRECVERYNIRDFIFWSDLFNFDRNWVLALSEAISSSGLSIQWSSNSRISSIDPEMVLQMKRAGCTLVSVGIESGNQAILDRIRKATTVQQVRESFRILKGAGMKTLAYYLIGLPWETEETINETITLSRELKSDYANFFVATPLPGTLYYEYARDHKLFDSEIDHSGSVFENAYYLPAVRGHHLDRTRIACLRKRAVRQFYLRPAFISRQLLRTRSVGQILLYSRYSVSLLKGLF